MHNDRTAIAADRYVLEGLLPRDEALLVNTEGYTVLGCDKQVYVLSRLNSHEIAAQTVADETELWTIITLLVMFPDPTPLPLVVAALLNKEPEKALATINQAEESGVIDTFLVIVNRTMARVQARLEQLGITIAKTHEGYRLCKRELDENERCSPWPGCDEV